MKILITGGCGFIGANLCLHLKKKCFNVSSLDNLSKKGSIYSIPPTVLFNCTPCKYPYPDK